MARGVRLTIYLHLVPTLRTNAAKPSTHLCLYSVEAVIFTSVHNMPLFFYVLVTVCTKFSDVFQYLLPSADATCRNGKFQFTRGAV